MARISAPTPRLPSERDGYFRCTLRHLHLCTDALHSTFTTAGGSMYNTNWVPLSVVTDVALWMVHSRRVAVRTYAAAGPVTLAQGLGLCIAMSLAWATLPSSRARLSHASQIADAHVPIGTMWAPKAGSTVPVREPSAIVSARSMSCPHGPETGA